MLTKKRILGRVVRIWRVDLPTTSDISIVWRVRSGGYENWGETRRRALRGLFDKIVSDLEN